MTFLASFALPQSFLGFFFFWPIPRFEFSQFEKERKTAGHVHSSGRIYSSHGIRLLGHWP